MIYAWRLVKEKLASGAFTGEGASLYGGRWNKRGVPVVYVAGSLSLAALETFVNIGLPEIKLRYVSIQVTIPDDVKVEEIPPASLPGNWRDDPAPDSTKEIGARWFHERKSAVLKVPSAVIPSEFNYVLNPEHLDFKKIKIGRPEPFCFDPRMCK